MPKERRVVITGLGPLCAIGFGKEALWKSILGEKSGLHKEEIFLDKQLWDSFWMHKIKDFNINNFGIDKEVLKEISGFRQGREDNDFLYPLAATQLALKDSGLDYNRDDNNIGFFLTIEHPGFEPFCESLTKEGLNYFKEKSRLKENPSEFGFYQHLFSKFSDYGQELQSFMYLYLVAKAMGFRGYSLFTNNACASGLFALDAAYTQIKFKDTDVAIIAGGDNPAGMLKHLWFKERNLYAEDGKIKPFSKNADGIVFGEGYSAILLEELNHAKKRGANIYAEYTGGGFSLEGWKLILPNPISNSYGKAIEGALKNSEIKAQDIDLINPHGVGIKITDQYEAKAITNMFGNKTPVSAFKPYVGHNLGGSAILESIILILALQNGIIPASLNCDDFDSRYNINLIRKQQNKKLTTVMKLSCGFAGYNAAAVFRKV
ncbi:MAG: beta-ketoacyl synthase N-terminal-like domain-containing protein [Candidatus Omnitrophota bacterium]